jgi:IS4 transposase
MNSGNTIFAQLMHYISHYDFQQCVKRHDGEYKVQSFSCWDQFLCLAFARLYLIHLAGAFFLTRAKDNTQMRRLYSRPVDKTTGVQCDQVVAFKNYRSAKDYPERLRRIRYRDPASGKRFVLLTNNFILPAEVIARLYKCRWQVELFFKWIKQHLRIKKFYGTSPNAVKTQIWIAIAIYVLIAIIKKRLRLERSLYSILQILSVTLFEKTPIFQALSQEIVKEQDDEQCKQLVLFD